MSGTLQILLLVAAVIVVVVAFVLMRRKGSGSGPLAGTSAKGEGKGESPSSLAHEKGKMGSPSGFALFLFRDGNWTLQEDFSKPGFVAVPPSSPGSFEGQVLRRESGIPAQS